MRKGGFAGVGWRLSAKLDSRDDSTSLLLVFGVGDEVLLFQMFESLKSVSRRILRRKWRRWLCGLTAFESHNENNDANHGTRKEDKDNENDDQIGAGEIEQGSYWGRKLGGIQLSRFS